MPQRIRGKKLDELGADLEGLLEMLMDTNAKSRRKLENNPGIQVHLLFCFEKHLTIPQFNYSMKPKLPTFEAIYEFIST